MSYDERCDQVLETLSLIVTAIKLVGLDTRWFYNGRENGGYVKYNFKLSSCYGTVSVLKHKYVFYYWTHEWPPWKLSPSPKKEIHLESIDELQIELCTWLDRALTLIESRKA